MPASSFFRGVGEGARAFGVGELRGEAFGVGVLRVGGGGGVRGSM